MKALVKFIEEYDAFEKIRQRQVGDSIEGRRIDGRGGAGEGLGERGREECGERAWEWETDKLEGGAGGGLTNTDGWPKRPGPQVLHQTWLDWGNEALRRSCDTGKPVRVVRSWNCVSDFAPYVGYRYDGLYIVTHACREKNQDGFYICRYNIERIPGQPPLPRRSRVGTNEIAPSRSSPASVVTSHTVVLPSGTSTSISAMPDSKMIHCDEE